MSHKRLKRPIHAALCVLLVIAAGLPAAPQLPVDRSVPMERSISAEPIEVLGPKLVTPATERAVERGLAYLASQQRQNGSFGSGRYRGNVAVTALSGMAFLAAGHTPGRGKYGRVVSEAITFLLSRAQSNGYIVDEEVRYHGPMYGHGFATLFLAETYGMTANKKLREELREKLKNAVRLIVNEQHLFQVNVNGVDVKGGGWRYLLGKKDADISVTVCVVMALRAARNCGIYVPKKTIDLSVAYVKACQNREDGGFRYQTTERSPSIFPRSAAAIVALYSAGIYKGPEIEMGLRYLKRFQPDGARQRKGMHYFYGHYYGVQAMWHAGGDYWKDWYPAVREEMLAEQHDDGHWRDTEVCNEYGTAMACLVLQTPVSYLPIFQR